MVTKGLLVRLQAIRTKEPDVEEFLRSALPLVEDEPETTAWFAVRFGRHEYGIFVVFQDELGRRAHLSGLLVKGLMERREELFAEAPQISKVDVFAAKVTAVGASVDAVTKALLLMLRPKSGHQADMETFLNGALPLVEQEPGTAAWFAIRTDDGHYGTFDGFPDNRARLAHLTGHVPRQLVKHATTLIGGLPDMDMLHVLAFKLPR